MTATGSQYIDDGIEYGAADDIGNGALYVTGISISSTDHKTSYESSVISIDGSTATIVGAGITEISAEVTIVFDGGVKRVSVSQEVTVNQATITITAVSQTAYNGYDEPTYTYTVTGLVGEETLETETIEVSLSTDALATIADSDVESLVITSDLATIAISTEALAEIIDQVAGDDVAISVAFTDTTDILSDALSAEQQAVIGDSVVIDMTIISGDDAITSIGGEKITITVPYELKDNEEADKIVVWHIADDGYITVLPTEYDEEIGTLEFSATEVVTFVIVNDTNEFVDVEPNDYFYAAVLWAVENGITTGYDDATFAPNEECSRDQIVTFLYRAESTL